MISQRARRALGAPSPLVTAHFKCVESPFHGSDNPGGYVNMGTAENYLLWDLVGPRLAATPPVPEHLTHYNELYGATVYREAVARFLGPLVGGVADPENVVAAAGASAILEILAFALAEPGDAFIVPTPYYSGFSNDLMARAQVEIVPAHTSSHDDFRLTRSALDTAWDSAAAAGKRVRAVLIANPQNPLGKTYDPATLDEILAFAVHHDLDVIFDEIYAHSVFGPGSHVPGLARATERRDRLHLVYGFAKDFGLSGYKMGILYTESPEVRGVARELAQYAAASTATQWVLTDMLSDAAWLADLVAHNRDRLSRAHRLIVEGLQSVGVSTSPSNAGVFIWLDLRAYLPTPDFAGEQRLFETLFNEGRLNITPGRAFSCQEPGWFRLCFAHPEAVLNEALRRLSRVLNGEPSP